ncbi:Eco57I restriction-modification methylase domain-containing protein [Heyndrickxia coagulans]|uniref:Eco57I restriction-modification methylase domain-containing protein n=1 Tax=Heyndrickxia coagulans TaxID=1398 RepID=UPI0002FA77A0|nr:N-6 DNA methylase [Heyndrickxia coagulans]
MVQTAIDERISNYMRTHGSKIDYEINSYMKDSSGNYVNEATFRHKVAPLIHRIAVENGIELDAAHEYTVFKGRIDTLYERVNLEYKKPGTISDNNNHSNNKAYIEEVKKQIRGLAKKDKIELSSILGVIFDGNYFIYIRYLNTDWSVTKPEKRTPETLRKFITKLFSLSMEKAVSITNLVKDFGVNSEVTTRAVKAFYQALTNNLNQRSIDLLFEQWKSLFREVSGYSFDSTKLKLKEIRDLYGFSDEAVQIDKLIFSIHSYYAFLIKLLTIDILFHNRNNKFKFLETAKYTNSDDLFEYLRDIENGARFKELGVSNFLEGDFFGWYLTVWNDDIFQICSTIVDLFNKYDYSTVHLDEDNTRDLLKNLYHHLLPKQLRHALGEYYSPDWLAQMTYNELGINGDLHKSILDPCVGSGTFIVIAIKAILERYPDIDKKVLLRKILENVRGYDLNPLAVIAARANYIIALDTLLTETDEDIEIPIYLCDSMLTILEQKRFNQKVKVLATRAGTYEIPTFYTETKTFNLLLDIITSCLDRNISFSNAWRKIEADIIVKQGVVSETVKSTIKDLTERFYEQLLELKKQNNIHKIWVQVIKNAFAPLYQDKVDFIIGNPPWVNWQTLPEDYRESIHTYWHQYKIFDHKGLEARLGSAHDDISVLLTYVVIDNFLKSGGKIGFIINQNLLQARGGGDGFRKFMIKEKEPIKVLKVHDFVQVQPFAPHASNKTAVFFAQRGEETVYPVNYTVWTKNGRGIIDTDENLSSVLEKISSEELVASPVKNDGRLNNSPWMIAEKNRANFLKKLVGSSSYKARKGIDTSANGIYWVKIEQELRNRFIVSNTPENSRKDIPKVEGFPIEKDLVYPLVRGKDLSKWHVETPLHIIVPYQSNLKNVLSMEELQLNYPLTYDYFYNHKDSDKFVRILETRGTYIKHYKSIKKGEDTPEVPVHVLYNIGYYTAAPYKVIWKALQNKGMNACVITEKDGKLILPDHNNVMVECSSLEEAHYLCGILNSKIVEEFIDSYISWFKSSHIVEHINIPTFDANDKRHQDIAKQSILAHQAVVSNKQDLVIIESKLDSLVIDLLSNN